MQSLKRFRSKFLAKVGDKRTGDRMVTEWTWGGVGRKAADSSPRLLFVHVVKRVLERHTMARLCACAHTYIRIRPRTVKYTGELQHSHCDNEPRFWTLIPMNMTGADKDIGRIVVRLKPREMLLIFHRKFLKRISRF